MDFELPEELRILKATLRRFVDNELIPIERETTDGEQLKPEYLERFERRAKELGIWQLDVPTEYGGGGMSILARAVVWKNFRVPSPYRRAARASPVHPRAASSTRSKARSRRNTCCRCYAGKRR